MDDQLPTLTLPSGGVVEFHSIDDLTGADVHYVRGAISEKDSAGETSNALVTRLIERIVKTWNIEYLADPRTPQANPTACRKLKLRDMLALEEHVSPALRLITVGAEKPSIDNTEPGSPTPPDSE